jgi:hypothetical protein
MKTYGVSPLLSNASCKRLFKLGARVWIMTLGTGLLIGCIDVVANYLRGVIKGISVIGEKKMGVPDYSAARIGRTTLATVEGTTSSVKDIVEILKTFLLPRISLRICRNYSSYIKEYLVTADAEIKLP